MRRRSTTSKKAPYWHDLRWFCKVSPVGTVLEKRLMRSPAHDAMSASERRAGMALAAIFALRMLGLFLVLPIFASAAAALPGGDDLRLVGLALGAYGLTQAALQIPFGMASDRYGRKPVIVVGLLLFLIGSIVAALAENLVWLLIGRIVQGAGAISAAITALAADLTREEHRTKMMAMIGSSIGLVFALSLAIAPPLYGAVGLHGVFWLTAALAAGAIMLLLVVVPPAPPLPPTRPGAFGEVLRDGQLMRLNTGVFLLHMMQTALWVSVPAALIKRGALPLASHWQVYLPAVLLSFLIMVPAVIQAERHGLMKVVFLVAIGLLLVVQLGLGYAAVGLWSLLLWLTLFFVGFNIVEAIQPSWISRIVPPHAKGAALGLYNTLQSLGLFVGGIAGGLLTQRYGADAVHLFCALLATLWLFLSLRLQAPARRRH